jgi:hypothetical protein
VDQSIRSFGARIQKSIDGFKPISKKTPHAISLFPEPDNRGNRTLARAFITLQVHIASGMGSIDIDHDDKLRHIFEI